MASKYKHERLDKKENVFVVHSTKQPRIFFLKTSKTTSLPLNIFVLIPLTFQCKASDLGYFNCILIVVGIYERGEKQMKIIFKSILVLSTFE